MRAPVLLYGETARNIISSREFSAFPMKDQYRLLSNRTGLDFSATIDFLGNLPIFLTGDHHKTTRRELANIYARTRNEQEHNVDVTMQNIEERLRSADGDFDVISGISNPLWVAISDAISDNLISDSELASELPDLFYPGLSIRRRKALNDRLTVVLKNTPAENRKDVLDGLALLTLGVRPLVHSLTLSIYKLALTNSMKALSKIEYPPTFLDSALRFIDRVGEVDAVVHDCPNGSGARFRCVSFDESYSDIENSKYLFGSGIHLCLGRSISNYVWKQLAYTFSRTEKKISPGILALRNQEPFKIVEKCSIVLSD